MPEPAPPFLALDQGTTSTRAMLFSSDGEVVAVAQRELPAAFPAPGWVEHDPERIHADAEAVIRDCLATAGVAPAAIGGLGITNQRETVVVWERATGRPIHPAIVWQDRRTAETCRRLQDEGHQDWVRERTGLLLDPYFSATKIAWILDQVPGARAAAERGELAAGTVDCWLTWRLTGGRVHATDASNASRTLLYDLVHGAWNEELCRFFDVPPALLPEVRDTVADYGAAEVAGLDGALAIRTLVGDQQSAAFGQACFAPGDVKATYGTGCFTVQNTGAEPVWSERMLLTTVLWRLDGATTYAIEGSSFNAGTAVQWLRDGLGLFDDAAETEELARHADPRQRVYLVPAFTGLGAPWWDPDARAAIHGLTREVGRPELVRAALEAVCFQTRDLLEAAAADGAPAPRELRVDGGMVRNDWLLQALADLLGLPVARPAVVETTALGAARLAALGAGYHEGLDAVAAAWRAERRAAPAMPEDEREERWAGWREAVRRTLTRR